MDRSGVEITGLRFESYHGREAVAILNELAQLRIRVFYDFPYLYEGSVEYEAHYLQRYTSSAESIVFGVWDEHRLVGATTGMPLKLEFDEVRKPFEELGLDVNSFFYFGESILLPEYRGKGIGHRFFDVREKHALSLGYSHTTFCSVIRPFNHPLRPAGYSDNEKFWLKRGYQKREDLVCKMKWLDRGAMAETEKSLVFFCKSWN